MGLCLSIKVPLTPTCPPRAIALTLFSVRQAVSPGAAQEQGQDEQVALTPFPQETGQAALPKYIAPHSYIFSPLLSKVCLSLSCRVQEELANFYAVLW